MQVAEAIKQGAGTEFEEGQSGPIIQGAHDTLTIEASFITGPDRARMGF